MYPLASKIIPRFLHPHLRRIENSALGSRLAKGAFWSLFGSLISRGLGLLSAILVGRMLGKNDYGALGIIQNTIGMFGTLAGLGMGLTANKHIAEFKRTNPERAGRILGVSSTIAWITSSVLAAIMIAGAPWLATCMLNAPQLGEVLRVGALLLLLGGVNGAQIGTLSGFEAFKSIAHINLVSGVLTFPLMIGGVWLWGITGAVWSLVGSQAVNCLLCHIAVRKESNRFGIHSSLVGWRSEWSLVCAFSVPAVITGLINSLVSWGASVSVVKQVSGYGDMGVYNAVMRVKLLPEAFLGMLIAPVLPVLSEAFGKGDRQGMERTLRFNFLLAFLLLIPVSLLQTAFPLLTVLPFGNDYQNRPEIVQWLMLHSVVYALLFPMGGILISMGKMWFSCIVNVCYAVMLFVLSCLLIPRYGAAGYAASTAISFALGNVPCVIFLYRSMPIIMREIQWCNQAFISIIAFVLVAIAGTCFPDWWALAVGFVISIAFVIFLLTSLRGKWSRLRVL